MEPVLSKAPLLLPLLQLLPNPMVLSQDILPSQRTLAMANRLPPLPHRGTCTPPLDRKVVTLTVIGTLLHVFFFSPLVSISYNANSQPSSYNQSNYSQPAAYGQQQQGYQAQQAGGYGQQQGYQQQGQQQQQQAPPAYPPQSAGSYGQPPSSQFSQQGGPPNYSQSNHYSKTTICFRAAFWSFFYTCALASFNCVNLFLHLLCRQLQTGWPGRRCWLP